MSIDTGNGGAATGCPCGCGAAEKAHCWKDSDWEANGRADEIVSALAAAVEGRRGDALRIAHAIGDGTVEAAVGLILRVPGMEQTSREAHQGIAREKAANERLRAEVEKLRGVPRPEDLPDDPEALKSIIRGLDVEIYGAMADRAAMKRATAG